MARDDTQRYPHLNHTLFKIMLVLIRTLVRLLTRVHVHGLKDAPREGPVIVLSNHLHYLDTPVLGVNLPRMGWVLAAEKYEYHFPFSIILKIGGSIFINRGEPDRRALRQALNVLEDGHQLGVAVEGTRSETGTLAKGKTGAAYLATRTDATLVPVVMWGTENIVAGWKKLRRPDVYVRYGEPFKLPEGRARSQQLDAYTEEIMTTLAALLPEQYRGYYTDHPLTHKKAENLPAPEEVFESYQPPGADGV